LGIGPNPQSPIPNPQSPIFLFNEFLKILYNLIIFIIFNVLKNK